MESSEKQKIFEIIKETYTEKHIKKFEKRFEKILEEISQQNSRSMIIMGCAYLEEMCMSCVLESMTEDGQKTFLKKHGREFTFSLATTILYSQDYFSNEILQLFDYIRDIRNKYAHIPLFEEKHLDSINDRNQKIRNLINKRWFSRDIERIKKIPDVDSQLYYIVFENLIFGLIALEMFIIPNQKLAKLQFIDGESFLRIQIYVEEINENSNSYFHKKFNRTA